MNQFKLYLLVFFVFPYSLRGQVHDDVGLKFLSQLSQEGRFQELVETAKPLLAGYSLSPVEQGKAWTYLGHAYQQEGDLKDAVPAYEKALEIMSRNGEDRPEYATTLSAFSSLYLDMNQPDVAKHILQRTLRLYEKQHNHAGMAMIWSNLGTIAVGRSAKGEAHKCVERAQHEVELAGDLGEDYYASFSSMQARLSELDGDASAAIPEYQHAISLWEHAHGPQHPEVGWLNVLLGRAYLEAGDIAQANEKTRKGWDMIAATLGSDNAKFMLAEIAYANVLEALNEHSRASAMRSEANARLSIVSRDCMQCRISAAALR
jgi:hypothetical protein